MTFVHDFGVSYLNKQNSHCFSLPLSSIQANMKWRQEMLPEREQAESYIHLKM
jgi:hypothetical protein